jgi:hypothetical protein
MDKLYEDIRFNTMCLQGERFMVFNATFINISAISWRSVLLVEEADLIGENTDLTQVTNKLYHIML